MGINLNGMIESTANTATGGLLGLAFDTIGRNNQNQQNAQQQQQQYQYQRALNEQAKELALQQWKDTNYSAQLKEMDKAGISASLLYGKGGMGGTTAQTGSGGNVGMATAQNTQGGGQLGLQFASQLALMKAQKENIEADTADKLANLPVKDKEAGLKGAQTTNTEANTMLTNLQADNQKVLNEITSESKEDVIGTLQENYKKAVGEAESALVNGRWSEPIAKQTLKNMQLDGTLTAIKAEAEKAGIKLTEEETRAISQELAQGWEELYQKARANDIAKGNQNINGFVAKANYAIDKANVNLRAKEVMIRGAETFIKGIQSRPRSTEQSTWKEGNNGKWEQTHSTTKYR